MSCPEPQKSFDSPFQPLDRAGSSEFESSEESPYVLSQGPQELEGIRNLLGKMYSGLRVEMEQTAGKMAKDERVAQFLDCELHAIQRIEVPIPDGDGAIYAVQQMLQQPPDGWSLEIKSFHRYDDTQTVPTPFIEIDTGYEERCYCVSEGYVFADTPLGRWIMEIGEKSMFSNDRTFTFFVNSTGRNTIKEVVAEFHKVRIHASRFKRQRICFGATGIRYLQDLGIGWTDVILEPHVVEELKLNVFSPMLDPETWRSAGLPLRRSLLLSGVPGTGKSQIGRLIASQIPETFIAVTADGIDSASDAQQIYRIARENRPTVLFFEDLDVVVSRRGLGSQVFGELLSQMDGFEDNEEIITLATTNHPEELDEALKDRPGRFDRHIVVDLPNESGREKLFRHFMNQAGVTCGQNTLKGLVDRSKGMSGAHIREVVVTTAMEAKIGPHGRVGPNRPLDLEHFLRAARKLERVRPQVGFRTS